MKSSFIHSEKIQAGKFRKAKATINTFISTIEKISSVTSEKYKQLPLNFVRIQTVEMDMIIEKAAPDFTLFDTEKKQQSLSDYRDKKVLLLFFPLAFTSVCTAELCDVRDTLKKYEALNVQPIGISVDSLYTLARYKQEQNLNFPLLSDFNKDVSTAYGVLYQAFGYGMKGVSKRAAFIIDEGGIIQYAEVLENASHQPNFIAIEVKLRELAG